jgi:hypothetical protein
MKRKDKYSGIQFSRRFQISGHDAVHIDAK